MNFLCSFSFLLTWIVKFHLGSALTDVSYEELEKLGASCNTLDNCKLQRDKDSLNLYTCYCGSFCSQLGTCCVDSPYRYKQKEIIQPSCESVYGTHNTHYFMEETCPVDTDSNNIWTKLCKNDNEEDLLSLVPVTSFQTNMTYKNYFCFRCNEEEHKYRFWNLKLHANVKSYQKEYSNIILTYVNRTWVAPIGEGGSTIPVTFSVEVPHDIQDLPKLCKPNVISSCSKDWKEDTEKCNSYTSIIHFVKGKQSFSYKNPHCALCNFENLENMICDLEIDGRAKETKDEKKMPFSFALLLDINQADGNLVGKITRCPENNAVWDYFANKCRILTCAVPGYVLRNKKCVPA